MKILFIGDVVGKPARTYLKQAIPAIRKKLSLDCVIANGENSAGGSSVTPDTAREIFASGIDIMTTGDHAFKKVQAREVFQLFDAIRPLNYGVLAAGKGYIVKECAGVKIAVINLLGRVFMQPVDCPFQAVRNILEEIRSQTPVIIVDMHAEATSEKLAMGFFLAGKVSAVIGTHTHIPTADERIIDDSTAYITDCGMTGSFDSILGRQKDQIIDRFVTNMPSRFNLAQDDVRIQGVILDIDEDTGKALAIQRFEDRADAHEKVES